MERSVDPHGHASAVQSSDRSACRADVNEASLTHVWRKTTSALTKRLSFLNIRPKDFIAFFPGTQLPGSHAQMVRNHPRGVEGSHPHPPSVGFENLALYQKLVVTLNMVVTLSTMSVLIS